MTPFRAIVFDFDLTLADTRQGVVECVNYALTGVGLPPAHPEAIIRTIGVTIEKSFPLWTEPHHADRLQEFLHLYREHSILVMQAMTTFYPSAPAVIRSLAHEQTPLGIVSSGRRQRIEATLHRAGLLECFKVIIGSEDVMDHKPDPTGLLEVVRRLGGLPPHTLYVGDSLVDAQTAQRANVPFAAVLSGETPKEAFAAHPTVGILGDVGELPALLQHLQQGQGGQP
ncbi:MAG: HAD-IA family hydrolase [Chloroflexi bacterium]|nr:HAD-IA family hydrolase [Chloroflexota bacterium]